MTLTFSLLLWISSSLGIAQGKKDRAQKEGKRYYENWLT
jgi:hypothetical protein